jgi:hypothetical protein
MRVNIDSHEINLEIHLLIQANKMFTRIMFTLIFMLAIAFGVWCQTQGYSLEQMFGPG